MTSILTNLFDGVAYGMLLFVLACGLAVTLGLMNFVNLAHGAFAMAGGYVCAVTFAFGCGLAGLGGALSAEVLGLDPYFPLKFMIYFLIVVTVGGSSSITGPFLASLLLGIGDVAGKYYVPKMGPFVIYTIMIVILIWRPNGLFGRTATR